MGKTPRRPVAGGFGGVVKSHSRAPIHEVGRLVSAPERTALRARPEDRERVGAAMSLVGNLEDLSLGDIMQIISLSQKSGVLVLEGDQGSGRIVFRSGLVEGAVLKGVTGHPRDVSQLMVAQGLLDPARCEAATARASELDVRLEETLAREAGLEPDEVDALVRDAVESAVLEMFTWQSGDFSFDVRTEREPGDPELLLSSGLNSQYLAMEGMRVCDERARDAGPAVSSEPEDQLLGEDELLPGEEPSAHAMFGVEPDAAPTAADIVVSSVLERGDAPTLDEVLGAFDAAEAPPVPTEEDTQDFEPPEEKPAPTEAPPSRPAPRRQPLVLIDPDVVVLEWVKQALADDYKQVHVFQRAEQGLARIRQYLIRGELPVVLISPEAEIDPLSGIRGLGDFIKRLKLQSARLPVFALCEAPGEADASSAPPPSLGGHLDGVLTRPERLRLREPEGAAEDPQALTLSHELASRLDAVRD